MFIEVYVIDALNKTPVALSETDTFFRNYFINLEVRDPLGSVIHEDNVEIANSTAVFAYKIPEDASGGEY